MAGRLRDSIDSFFKPIKNVVVDYVVDPIKDVAGGIKDVITLDGAIDLNTSGRILGIDELQMQIRQQYPDATDEMVKQLALSQQQAMYQADMAKKDEGFLSSSIAPESVDARMVSLNTNTTTAPGATATELVIKNLTNKILNPNESIADNMTRQNELFKYQDAISVDPQVDTEGYLTIKLGD
jgi:hypothetical protein|tara:strand:- start:7465 stop:8010 length:546 start_codon:yes stop_codon:yes gene_type:complete